MSRSLMLTLVSLSLALTGCSSKMKVATDFDPSHAKAISAYKTYAWLPLPTSGDSRINDEFVAQHVVPEVDRLLAAKGFERDTTGTTDFLVGYIVTLQAVTDVKTANTYYGYEYGYEGATGPGYTTTYDVSYEQGTLILDVVDTERDQIVWRGTAQAKTGGNPDPKKQQERLAEAVQKILDKFPPEAR
jgi:hypothetical protein